MTAPTEGGSMQMQAHELPPPVQMTQLLAGFQLSQALYVAAALASRAG